MKTHTTIILIAGCFLSACGKFQRPVGPDDLVVATTTMVADLVRVVGGGDVTTEALMRPGVDPHLYKASPADVSKLNRSKVIFYNGLLLEGRMTDLFERLVKSGKPVYAVTDAIPAEQRLAPHGSEGHPDPHVWGDASLWALTVDEVVKGLSTSFPDKAAAFQERGLAYKQALGELHDWAKQRITTIPEGKRKLVTSHDAFSYFGRAYGVDVVGVAGISTASEASVADRTRMVDYIKQHQVAAIFVESSVNRTLIDRISKDANVNVGGLLYSDAMDEPGKMETIDGETYDLGTYSGMLKHNVNTVVEALK